MRNRLLSFLFVLMLIASVTLPIEVVEFTKATVQPELRVEPDYYRALKLNETFDIAVTVNNLEASLQLVSVQFRLCYNDTLLEVVDVQEGPFLKDPRWNLYGTYFIHYVETDPIYGPNVLVGILLLPNATGQYDQTNFPEGNGTLATITFKAIYKPEVPNPAEVCGLNLEDALLLDKNLAEIPYVAMGGSYRVEPGYSPVAIFTYDPTINGKVIFFDATESYDPDGEIVSYLWNFGDGSVLETTGSVTIHTFEKPGTYNVTLTVTDNSGLTNTMTLPVEVYAPVDIQIDAGALHFRGEIVDFYISVAYLGEAVNLTKLNATLYFEGAVYADLSNLTQYVNPGLYMISYNIPADASAGTYTLVVNVEYYDAKGVSLKSFQINPTLTGFITEVDNKIAYISNGISEIKLNLTAVNAKLVSIEGTIAIINSTVGTISADIEDLDAEITDLIVGAKGEIIAKIDTSLGTVTTTLGDISDAISEVDAKIAGLQSLSTTGLTIASIFSILAAIIAAIAVILLRKK